MAVDTRPHRKARQLRRDQGFSLRAVEAATGIDHATIGRFEQGGFMREQNVSAYARLLTELCGRPITIDELLASENGQGEAT